MHVENWIRECGTHGTPVAERHLRGDTRYIFVHRFGHRIRAWRERNESAVSLAAACAQHPELQLALGRAAYHLVVLPSGAAQQTTTLRYSTPHAASYNAHSVAIVLLKDEHQAPTLEQYATLAELCAVLCVAYEVPVDPVMGTCAVCHGEHAIRGLVGHDEVPHATSTPGKVCPEIDMGLVRASVRDRLAVPRTVPSLKACGMVR